MLSQSAVLAAFVFFAASGEMAATPVSSSPSHVSLLPSDAYVFLNVIVPIDTLIQWTVSTTPAFFGKTISYLVFQAHQSNSTYLISTASSTKANWIFAS